MVEYTTYLSYIIIIPYPLEMVQYSTHLRIVNGIYLLVWSIITIISITPERDYMVCKWPKLNKWGCVSTHQPQVHLRDKSKRTPLPTHKNLYSPQNIPDFFCFPLVRIFSCPWIGLEIPLMCVSSLEKGWGKPFWCLYLRPWNCTIGPTTCASLW